MAVAVGEVVREVLKGGSTEPVLLEASPAPSAPPRMNINGRAEKIVAFLRTRDSAEGQHAALTSILASATFPRERRGEAYTIGVLHQVEAITSRAAALDRWRPERGVVQ